MINSALMEQDLVSYSRLNLQNMSLDSYIILCIDSIVKIGTETNISLENQIKDFIINDNRL